MELMELVAISVPLLLVIDPFGNLPFVIAVFGRLSGHRYFRAVSREMAIAATVLVSFALLGQRLLGWFGIDQASLRVAGGVVLFIIALRMIFGSAAELFDADEALTEDPVAVPVAIPSVAGPSALATILFMASLDTVPKSTLIIAIVVVCLMTWAIFAAGRPIAAKLGPRGQTALEKLTGMVLSILAVHMTLAGLRAVFGGGA